MGVCDPFLTRRELVDQPTTESLRDLIVIMEVPSVIGFQFFPCKTVVFLERNRGLRGWLPLQKEFPLGVRGGTYSEGFQRAQVRRQWVPQQVSRAGTTLGEGR